MLAEIAARIWERLAPPCLFGALFIISASIMFESETLTWLSRKIYEGVQFYSSAASKYISIASQYFSADNRESPLHKFSEILQSNNDLAKSLGNIAIDILMFVLSVALYVLVVIFIIIASVAAFIFSHIILFINYYLPPYLYFDFTDHFVKRLKTEAARALVGFQGRPQTSENPDHFELSQHSTGGTGPQFLAANTRSTLRHMIKSDNDTQQIVDQMRKVELFFSATKLSVWCIAFTYVFTWFSDEIRYSADWTFGVLIVAVHLSIMYYLCDEYRHKISLGIRALTDRILLHSDIKNSADFPIINPLNNKLSYLYFAIQGNALKREYRILYYNVRRALHNVRKLRRRLRAG